MDLKVLFYFLQSNLIFIVSSTSVQQGKQMVSEPSAHGFTWGHEEHRLCKSLYSLPH